MPPVSVGQTVTELARAINRLADSTELRQKIGCAATERIREVFAWEKLPAKMAPLYDRACGAAGREKVSIG